VVNNYSGFNLSHGEAELLRMWAEDFPETAEKLIVEKSTIWQHSASNNTANSD